MQFSGYTAEVYRAGMEQVVRGQWEAARALNLETAKLLRLVILPQAMRPILPDLGNYLISMSKDSSYLAVMTVYELLGTPQQLAAQSFNYTTLFTALGLIYIALALPSSMLVRALERRPGEGPNRVRPEGVGS